MREAQGRSVGRLCQVRSPRARAEISANGVWLGYRHPRDANTDERLLLELGQNDCVSRLVTRVCVVLATNIRRTKLPQSTTDALLIDFATVTSLIVLYTHDPRQLLEIHDDPKPY